MSIWGKIIGGTSGFLAGGPLGGLLGVFAGHAIDKINNSIGRNMISNSFVIRNIENVNLQKIEYLLSQIKLYINLYLNSYNQILNLNEMNELFKIINNIFQKSKNI